MAAVLLLAALLPAVGGVPMYAQQAYQYQDGRVQPGTPADEPLRHVGDSLPSTSVPNFHGPAQAPGSTPALPGSLRGWECALSSVEVARRDTPSATVLPGTLQAEVAESDSILQHVAGGAKDKLEDMRNMMFPHVDAKAKMDDPEVVPMRDVTNHFFSDVDGRAEYAVLGTPGGDVAEFILAMSALERARKPYNTLLGQEDVTFYLQDYLESTEASGRPKKMYMGTDTEALRRWAEHTGVKNPLQPRTYEETDKVVHTSIFPNHIGSQTLRHMLEHPTAYKIRTELAEYVIQAFLKIYFDADHPMRSRLLFVALDGPHVEQGVVEVAAPAVECGHTSPLIVPRMGNSSFYVYHPFAVDSLRREMADYVDKKLQIDSKGAVLAIIRELGAEVAKQFFAKFAATLPHYDAIFTHKTA